MHVNASAHEIPRGVQFVRRLFWRLHFWGGLIVTPALVFAALTGMLYVFTPQIESWRHGHLDRVPPSGRAASLDAQVAAAQALDGGRVRFVVPAHTSGSSGSTGSTGSTTRVHLQDAVSADGGHDHGLPRGRIVYVDPADARVVGSHAELDRFQNWARKLHASALQGDGWRWVIELAAAWTLVLALMGIALWWPRRAGAPGPDPGRARWRRWHTLPALSLGGVLLVVLVTGLTWSAHSGERFRTLLKALDQQAPRPASDLRSRSDAPAALGWDEVWIAARARAPDVRMQITPPASAGGVWRVDHHDRSQPRARFAMSLDAVDGRVLHFIGWDDLPWMAKATAVGIPFHRGEFGAWNQALLGLMALVCVLTAASGWAMWLCRRPPRRLAAPPLPDRSLARVPWWLWLSVAALAYALPLFFWSLCAFVSAEVGVRLLRGLNRSPR